MFIDEAYTLCNDSFGLEVINTLVEKLDAGAGADMAVFMAGYSGDMEK